MADMSRHQQRDVLSLSKQQLETSPSQAVDKIVQLLNKMPELPPDALKQAMQLLVALPEEASRSLMQLLVGKISHDFALQFLVLLSETTKTSNDPTSFDLTNQVDQSNLTKLLGEWAELTSNIRVRHLEDFRRFVSLSIGLQKMMVSAPAIDKVSWVYDASNQYSVALRSIHALPHEIFTAFPNQLYEIRVVKITSPNQSKQPPFRLKKPSIPQQVIITEVDKSYDYPSFAVIAASE